jgi:hypothetical protein
MVKRDKANGATPPLKTLRARLKRAAAEYPALRANRESEVVRWQWASDPCFDLRPYQAEISGFSRGEPLSTEPADKGGMVQYGFDAASRVVVVRGYGSLPGRYTEEFFSYTGEGAEAVLYEDSPNPKEVINVTHYVIQGGNVVSFQLVAHRGGGTTQTYEYHNGRVSRIHVKHGKSRTTPEWGREFEVVQDDRGELVEIIAISPGGQRSCQFRRPTRALDELLPAIQTMLLDQIPRAVAKAPIAETVYCLGLAYTTESYECLPPRLALGLAKKRAVAVQRARGERPVDIWNLDVLDTFEDVQLRDAGLNEACAMANQHFQIQGTIALGEALLRDVARALNNLRWENMPRITEDFVVYAADVEKGGAVEDLATCIPSERLSALRARNLL